MDPIFSVVVPVYNEADFIPEALPQLERTLDETRATYEILVVENGSQDGTAGIAASLAGPNTSVTSLETPDYGIAMRHGFIASKGQWVVNFDIDYFSAAFLRGVLEQPDTVDLVIGSKRDPESDDRRPMVRKLATRVFNLLLRVLLGSEVSDTHGMKAFRRELVDDIVPQVVSAQDLFDTELVIRAERSGYRIVEVPVVVEELRAAKSSLLKRAPRTVAGLVRIRRLLKGDSG